MVIIMQFVCDILPYFRAIIYLFMKWQTIQYILKSSKISIKMIQKNKKYWVLFSFTQQSARVEEIYRRAVGSERPELFIYINPIFNFASYKETRKLRLLCDCSLLKTSVLNPFDLKYSIQRKYLTKYIVIVLRI